MNPEGEAQVRSSSCCTTHELGLGPAGGELDRPTPALELDRPTNPSQVRAHGLVVVFGHHTGLHGQRFSAVADQCVVLFSSKPITGSWARQGPRQRLVTCARGTARAGRPFTPSACARV